MARPHGQNISAVHPPKSEATIFGYLDQMQKNVRTTNS